MRILVLDDDGPRTERLTRAAARVRDATVLRRSPSDALAALSTCTPECVVLGPSATDGPDAAALVGALTAAAPGIAIVAVSEHDATAVAVAVMKAGARDVIVLGHRDADDALTLAVGSVGAAHPREAARAPGGGDALDGLIGQSRAMQQVRQLVRTAARTEAHVLIEGETGTGKEVVARAVHALGGRGRGPFVPINCAAIPETLAESELFGHARGAFTGAVQEHPGALRLADRGTLFLDEIENLTPSLQAKLLRVVQDREVRPLGGTTTRRVDVRIVAASNRDLWRMVEAGEFRRDLYYRLRVLEIALPALRQRREDVPELIAHFVTRYNRRHGTHFTMPPPAALRPLIEHVWPGNVRELENTLESLLTLAGAADADLAHALCERQSPGGARWGDERSRILRLLDEHRWNRQRTAAALGISRVTLWRRMERHGIRDPLAGGARETG